MFSYFFFSALYLQLVLEYTPLEVGLAYLPGTIIWERPRSAFDRLVMRYGIKPPLLTGLSLMVLALPARADAGRRQLGDRHPPRNDRHRHRAGIAFNPILLAAMSGVAPDQAGLASGVVSTAFMMGGASAPQSSPASPTRDDGSLIESGQDSLAALNGGYHLALVVGAAFLIGAAAVSAAPCESRHRKRTEARSARPRPPRQTDASVHFERFESALWQTTSLLLVADDEAVVIDPCISAGEVERDRRSSGNARRPRDTRPRDARRLGSRLWNRRFSRRRSPRWVNGLRRSWTAESHAG